MDVGGAALTPSAGAADRPLPNGLRTGNLTPVERARMRQAAREFESIFIGQILKSMRQASAHGKTLLSGTGQRVYQDMMDEEFSKAMSQGGGIGLADLLMKDLLRQAGVTKKASSPPPGGPIGESVGRETAAGGAR